jgi:hypothetical protein
MRMEGIMFLRLDIERRPHLNYPCGCADEPGASDDDDRFLSMKRAWCRGQKLTVSISGAFCYNPRSVPLSRHPQQSTSYP